jgi:uncharacterized protein (DUF1501 family)
MDRRDFPNLRTRRDFFRQASCAAVGALSIATTLRDLRLINIAAAQGALSDYKALVCIFLSGGNDGNNVIIPHLASEYSNYAAVRQNLSLPLLTQHKLNIDSAYADGHEYMLHPACGGQTITTANAATYASLAPTGGLWKLFDEDKAAMIFNVGPLLHPVTRSQYQAKSVALPPQLFSHSDQVTHWQTSLPDQPPRTGWGGRIADILHPQQYQLIGGVPSSNSAKIALCTSLAGANTFEVGNSFAQYHVSTSGALVLRDGQSSVLPAWQVGAMQQILDLSDTNLQRNAIAGVTSNAIETGDLLNDAVADTANANYWTVQFPTTSLGNQLRMVARLIAARSALNMKRQIFFTSVGGYDTHTSQVVDTNPTSGSHANLLNELSNAIYAFQRAMEQIGVPDKVTSFTASDFGRTFPTNGQGSDHGWGNHHFIVGGAVKGGRTYGAFPVLQVGGPDDTSTGRWIPKIAVDEYSATLARWFGVSAGDLTTVFPNIGRFTSPDLGFML